MDSLEGSVFVSARLVMPLSIRYQCCAAAAFPGLIRSLNCDAICVAGHSSHKTGSIPSRDSAPFVACEAFAYLVAT